MSLELLAKDHELDLFIDYKDELIAKPMEFLNNLNLDDFELEMEDWYNISNWLDEDQSKLIYKLLARIILDGSATAQALTGMMYNKLRYNSSRAYIVDLMLNAISQHPMISSKREGMYIVFRCKQRPSKEILDKRKAMSFVLPSTELPLKVTDNNHIGYRTINESIICGGVLKHHDKPLNLAHINRLNSNPYRVEHRIQFLYQPAFDPTPKLKDSGIYEDERDVSKRYESWKLLIAELPEKTKLLAQEGNRFYIHHKFDNGGRTYAKAFHLNYQGEAYCKAIVQAYNKELVEPDF